MQNQSESIAVVDQAATGIFYWHATSYSTHPVKGSLLKLQHWSNQMLRGMIACPNQGAKANSPHSHHNRAEPNRDSST
jgi:hypothetical protein